MSEPKLSVEIANKHGYISIRLSGTLDRTSEHILERGLASLEPGGLRIVEVDITNLVFTDARDYDANDYEGIMRLLQLLSSKQLNLQLKRLLEPIDPVNLPVEDCSQSATITSASKKSEFEEYWDHVSFDDRFIPSGCPAFNSAQRELAVSCAIYAIALLQQRKADDALRLFAAVQVNRAIGRGNKALRAMEQARYILGKNLIAEIKGMTPSNPGQ